eukprot:CAMPEP_0197016028 /NCGR_PEP_ID=MMETSP1380-20130617/76542_1 /TAXON_ID=5936 /ORGANISM="Euplotes crassus, Strain CT5" /LENGTH=195 /DNA_ID=CAMNT_0042442465 /DNA_START=190 /DNA_END=774 /DNA_ORIENTATION=+
MAEYLNYLESSMGITLAQSFTDPDNFLLKEWRKTKDAFLELLCSLKSQLSEQTCENILVICQKKFDFSFREKIVKEGIHIIDQIGVAQVDQFKKGFGIQQEISSFGGLKAPLRSGQYGTLQKGYIEEINEESYFKLECKETYTCVLYNNFKEFIDYKEALQASFEEFKKTLLSDEKVITGSYFAKLQQVLDLPRE